jgi:hypothetical protein
MHVIVVIDAANAALTVAILHGMLSEEWQYPRKCSSEVLNVTGIATEHISKSATLWFQRRSMELLIILGVNQNAEQTTKLITDPRTLTPDRTIISARIS